MPVFNNMLAGASGGAGADYAIERSLRFNSGDSAFLNRNFGSSGNRRTYTISFWIKLADNPSGDNVIAGHMVSGFQTQTMIRINNLDYLEFGQFTGSWNFRKITQRVFRDFGAWYHIVWSVDTTLSTAEDRIKLYVNGVRETAWSTNTNPSQNLETLFNSNVAHAIGKAQPVTQNYGNYYLADVHFIDGQALAATDFGETDQFGVWQPKEFAGSYTSSSFSTNITPSSTAYPNTTLSNNNLTWTGSTANDTGTVSTLIPTNKKTYVEVTHTSTGGGNPGPGVANAPLSELGLDTVKAWWRGGTDGNISVSTLGSFSGSSTSWSNGDVLGIALDNTANSGAGSITFYKNGTQVWTGGSGWTSHSDLRFEWQNNGSGTSSGTWNFGATSFSYPLSGYTGLSIAQGANSFHLDFKDNSSNGALGFDSSSTGLNRIETGSVSNGVPVLGSMTFTGHSNAQAANLRDNNTSTSAADGGGLTTSTNMGYDFLIPYKVRKIQTIGDTTNGVTYSSVFNIQYSDNNSTWTTVTGSNTTHSFTAGNGVTDETTIDDNGAHRYWRLYYSSSSGTGGNIWIASLNMFADDIGVNNWLVNNLSVSVESFGAVAFDGSTTRYVRHNSVSVSSTWTLEMHFKPNNSSVIGLFDTAAGSGGAFRNYAANNIQTTNGDSQSIAGAYNVGQWNHFAVVRQAAGNDRVYINGTLVGSQRNFSGLVFNQLDIGTINGGGDGKFNGYIRNVRWSNNARYTANFTAPPVATDLTSDSNTQILMMAGSLGGNSSAGSPVYSVPSGAAIDSLVDTPTNGDTADDTGAGGEVVGNYATLNPLTKGDRITLSDGNLEAFTNSTAGNGNYRSNIAVSSGKWYVEVTALAVGNTNNPRVGIILAEHAQSPTNGGGNSSLGYDSDTASYANNGDLIADNSNAGSANSYTVGDVIGIAVDADNGAVYFSKNGVFQNSGVPTSGATKTGAIKTWSGSKNYLFAGSEYNSSKTVWNFGARPFAHAAPSGYKALCTSNFDPPTIADGSLYFDTKLYTGTGSALTISNYGFSPDLAWIKCRNATLGHNLVDTVRGANYTLFSNTTGAESTQTDRLTAFTSDGFTLGTNAAVNTSSNTHVAWAWDAGDSTVSNTDGTITSQVRASAASGFSIVKWTGDQNKRTIGHGLNKKPDLIIWKSATYTSNWAVWHSAFADNEVIFLNSTAAKAGNSDYFDNSAPTSTVFPVDAFANKNLTNLAYVFTSVEGYSAFGSYTGNGSADGPFVYTGHSVAWVMIRRTDAVSEWVIYDVARDTYNIGGRRLYPDLSNLEGQNTSHYIDILSNGFKVRSPAGGMLNASGEPYIYMSFASNPFASNGGIAR
ncbi:hypothetical protein OAE68_01355 [Synechococcus sp. AH-551-A10]|nr:SPRY domain-containing protein [Synechococcus sp. AH-551-A10]MDB4682306.1 hypothetical protein [Synechococcus sp. AH-551-A10]